MDDAEKAPYAPEPEEAWRKRIEYLLDYVLVTMRVEYRAGTAMNYGFEALKAYDVMRRKADELEKEWRDMGWNVGDAAQ